MTVQEIAGTGIFIAAVASVYLGAVGLVVHAIASRHSPQPKKIRWAGRTVFSLALFGIGCFLYGYFIEPYWPEIHHVRLESRKLKMGSGPLRIVQLSDLHCDIKPRLEKRLVELVADQKPDLIVFTGDAINTPRALPLFRKTLEALSHVAPTYAVRGNWDVWFWSYLDLFGGTETRVLTPSPASLVIRGIPLLLVGADIGQERALENAIRTVPKNQFTILAYHYPDLVEDIRHSEVDLYLAGHTHGGQIRLPFYGALMTLSRFGKKYEAGLYPVGTGALYVNRGIGLEGGGSPRVRFLCRPEITVFDIYPRPA